MAALTKSSFVRVSGTVAAADDAKLRRAVVLRHSCRTAVAANGDAGNRQRSITLVVTLLSIVSVKVFFFSLFSL